MLAVALVFGQTAGHGFIDCDDHLYVYENPEVSGGLTFHGIAWAFTERHASNWHPLTWISHMLDCQLFGLKAGGHHLTSAALHAAVAVLLFLALLRMTSRIWPSAFAAALFAIHPLRVESVAWVAERKDVLSGLFFMLTLLAYVRYTRRDFSWLRYLGVFVPFLLGLLCKAMLVTLPFVLLLLDYWPLQRFDLAAMKSVGAETAMTQSRFRIAMWLLIEKLPMIALSAVFCAVTMWCAECVAAIHGNVFLRAANYQHPRLLHRLPPAHLLSGWACGLLSLSGPSSSLEDRCVTVRTARRVHGRNPLRP